MKKEIEGHKHDCALIDRRRKYTCGSSFQW